jgi:hypothetical protein
MSWNCGGESEDCGVVENIAAVAIENVVLKWQTTYALGECPKGFMECHSTVPAVSVIYRVLIFVPPLLLRAILIGGTGYRVIKLSMSANCIANLSRSVRPQPPGPLPFPP